MEFDAIKQLSLGRLLPATETLVQTLSELNLAYSIDASKQVSLNQPLELLDANLIRDGLHSRAAAAVTEIDVHWSIDSTNTFLMGMLGRDDNFAGRVCTAERQTAGRGRRGRQWISPFGRNVYLSFAWVLPRQRPVEGLSLMVGLQAARSIAQSGGGAVALKWPNDILLNGGKVAGVLIELGSPRGAGQPVVIGIGINLQLTEREAEAIEQPWSAIDGSMTRGSAVDEVSGGDGTGDGLSRPGLSRPGRNDLATRLLNNLVDGLQEFGRSGFAPFRSAWRELDYFNDQPVRLLLSEKTVHGVNRGVDETGHLLLETTGELTRYSMGEVSLRAGNGEEGQ